MCWHSPDLPLGLFGMSLLLPRNSGASNLPDLGAVGMEPGTQGCPMLCRLSCTLAQAEPLAPTAAVLAWCSPDRCWGDL